MNKAIKIISVLLIVIVLASVANSVFAISPGDINAVNPKSEDTTDIKNVAGKILGWIQAIAAVAAVIIIAILGLKYMIGSTEERADYKKSFIPLIVGIVVVLGASTIAKFLWGIKG